MLRRGLLFVGAGAVCRSAALESRIFRRHAVAEAATGP